MTAVLFLCTGNAARSVMAGVALQHLRPDLEVETAGTLCVDGMPISFRTRAALHAVSLPCPRHRSKQATAAHLDRADLIIGLAPDHVDWVRREHTSAAARTLTLACLASGERSSGPPLASRELQPWEEIVDPGGGEVEQFVACARIIVNLIGAVAPTL